MKIIEKVQAPTTDKFEDILNFLSNCGGSCLYWQLPNVDRALAAVDAGVVILNEENDLLIHPDHQSKDQDQ